MGDIDFSELFDDCKSRLLECCNSDEVEEKETDFDPVYYVQEALNLAKKRKAEMDGNYEVIIEVDSQVEALRAFNVLEIVTKPGEIKNVEIDVDENFGNKLTSIFMNVGNIPVTISCDNEKELYYGECVKDVILVDLRFISLE